MQEATDGEARGTAGRRPAGSTLGTVAIGIGVAALLVSPIPILGWAAGLGAAGTGVVAARRPGQARLAGIAIALGVAAILVGVFFLTLNVARTR